MNLTKTAVILAFDDSKAFPQDKGTIPIEGKPLLSRVVNTAENAADEVIVLTATQKQVDLYKKLVPTDVRFVVSENAAKGDLAMALDGFEASSGEYTLLLPYDSPFIAPDVASLIVDLCVGKNAVIARTPDCEAEVMHAAYNTKNAIEEAKAALAVGETDMEAFANRLRCVRYLSTMVIEQLDDDLKSFFRVLTPIDIKKTVVLSKPRIKQKKTKR
jgi:molybdopterin-guanine dinucleotide biosynthesis protein A